MSSSIFDPTINLSSDGDWQLIADESRTAQVTEGSRIIPIDSILVGRNLTTRAIAILVTVDDIRGNWNFAGQIHQEFAFPPNNVSFPLGEVHSPEYRIRLARPESILFRNLSTESFDLRYFPPKYFPDVRVRVWEYTGEVVSQGQEQLNQISEALQINQNEQISDLQRQVEEILDAVGAVTQLINLLL